MFQRKFSQTSVKVGLSTISISKSLAPRIYRDLPDHYAKRLGAAFAEKSADGLLDDYSADLQAAEKILHATRKELNLHNEILAALTRGELPESAHPVVQAAAECFGVSELVSKQIDDSELEGELSDTIEAVTEARDALRCPSRCFPRRFEIKSAVAEV